LTECHEVLVLVLSPPRTEHEYDEIRCEARVHV